MSWNGAPNFVGSAAEGDTVMTGAPGTVAAERDDAGDDWCCCVAPIALTAAMAASVAISLAAAETELRTISLMASICPAEKREAWFSTAVFRDIVSATRSSLRASKAGKGLSGVVSSATDDPVCAVSQFESLCASVRLLPEAGSPFWRHKSRISATLSASRTVESTSRTNSLLNDLNETSEHELVAYLPRSRPPNSTYSRGLFFIFADFSGFLRAAS